MTLHEKVYTVPMPPLAGGEAAGALRRAAIAAFSGGEHPPPPSLPYELDTSRPSPRTNRTRPP